MSRSSARWPMLVIWASSMVAPACIMVPCLEVASEQVTDMHTSTPEISHFMINPCLPYGRQVFPIIVDVDLIARGHDTL